MIGMMILLIMLTMIIMMIILMMIIIRAIIIARGLLSPTATRSRSGSWERTSYVSKRLTTRGSPIVGSQSRVTAVDKPAANKEVTPNLPTKIIPTKID